jgi:hypothetical protein
VALIKKKKNTSGITAAFYRFALDNLPKIKAADAVK